MPQLRQLLGYGIQVQCIPGVRQIGFWAVGVLLEKPKTATDWESYDERGFPASA